MRRAGSSLAFAIVAALTASGCHAFSGCASDVCTLGTVQHVGPADSSATWAVRADDGTVYSAVPALPVLFRRDGLRVRLVARKHRDGGSHAIEVVKIETI